MTLSPLPRRVLAAAGAASLALVAFAPAATAAPRNGRHVLLISIDGMHQSDLAQYVAAHPTSTLAQLAAGGTEYTAATTTEPSDSFPGMLAMATGGTPKSTGVYYDDSYDRTLYAPGSACQGTPGTETQFAENLDTGAATSSRTILGESIDPAQLPLAKGPGNSCTPVYPNDFVGTNTIFSIAHASGLRTAWADKHPAYQLLDGRGAPHAITDLFTPEINADIIPSELTDTRGTHLSFPLTASGFAITDSVGDTESYDQIKVDAVLNEIDGMTSAGAATSPAGQVPAIFGMNFQSVSVGQKLVDPLLSCARSNGAPGCDPSYVPGGYEPGSLQFTPQLAGALDYVDGALAQLVHEIDARGLAGSTEIILSAKHGQAPIDPTTAHLVGDPLTPVITAAGGSIAQLTTDDVGLLWLKDPSRIAAVAQALRSAAGTDFASRVLEGGTVPPADPSNSMYPQFGYPGKGSLQGKRQPDIIVIPQPGVIYSSSSAKVAEHGGFSTDDTSVPLVVDATTPQLTAAATTAAASTAGAGQVATPVTTTQIAPTILQYLGLNYLKLGGVQKEGTQPLPSGPPPALPETPLAIALPVAALGLGGWVLHRRRRSTPAAGPLAP